MGSGDRVLDCLKKYADREDDGSFMVRGEDSAVVSLLGAGQEYVIKPELEIRVKGVWKPMVPLLCGGILVHVI